MNKLQLHAAGALIKHDSPFSDLTVHVSEAPLPAELRDKWVRPLYFGLRDLASLRFAREHLHEIDGTLIATLLSQFDWRSRTVAAHLAAITQNAEFQDEIGTLLLRSDVCYAAFGYCAAIATFNTKAGIEYLLKYLDYYLTRPDLQFDQTDVMTTLIVLDKINRTNYAESFSERWYAYKNTRSGVDLNKSVEGFFSYLKLIKSFAVAPQS